MNQARLCPACSRELPETLQAQFCPFCGASLEAAEPSSAEADSPTSVPAGPEESAPKDRPGIPWEDRSGTLSFVQRLTQTWSQATLQPGEFFRNMRVDGGAGPALLYALLMIIMGQSFNVFWQRFLAEQMLDQFGELSPLFEQLFAVSAAQQLMLVPFVALFGLFVGTLIYHLCLVIVGGAKNGMSATFRVLAYAEGTQLFLVIPVLGQFIAMVWSVVLIIIGFKEAHETTTGRAVLAFLLPILFCCALVLVFVFMLGGILSNVSGLE